MPKWSSSHTCIFSVRHITAFLYLRTLSTMLGAILKRETPRKITKMWKAQKCSPKYIAKRTPVYIWKVKTRQSILCSIPAKKVYLKLRWLKFFSAPHMSMNDHEMLQALILGLQINFCIYANFQIWILWIIRNNYIFIIIWKMEE